MLLQVEEFLIKLNYYFDIIIHVHMNAIKCNMIVINRRLLRGSKHELIIINYVQLRHYHALLDIIILMSLH